MDRQEQFRIDVERFVCKHLNKVTHNPCGVALKPFELTPESIRTATHRMPYTTARQFCFWLMRAHPAAKRGGVFMSSTKLGKEYKRDHTTVIYSVAERIPGYVSQKIAHPYALILQDVCDDLAKEWGEGFCIWSVYGLKRPPDTMTEVKARIREHVKMQRGEVAALRATRNTAKLDARNAKIITLRVKEKLPVSDICERFGISPTTARKIIGDGVSKAP